MDFNVKSSNFHVFSLQAMQNLGKSFAFCELFIIFVAEIIK